MSKFGPFASGFWAKTKRACDKRRLRKKRIFILLRAEKDAIRPERLRIAQADSKPANCSNLYLGFRLRLHPRLPYCRTFGAL
jgi:hypothetical protein